MTKAYSFLAGSVTTLLVVTVGVYGKAVASEPWFPDLVAGTIAIYVVGLLASVGIDREEAAG